MQEDFEDDGGTLKELTEADGKKANRKDSKQVKEQFYSELEYYAISCKGLEKGLGR